MSKLDAIIEHLTLEEKAALCSGMNFWETTPIERLGIPSIYLSDGPHGLRREVVEAKFGNIMQTSAPATCFPPAVTMASTWDKDLIVEVGRAIADEALEQGISTVLGPGVNIKRTPLCGRNFEYFSEDPYLSGVMATSYINGLQESGVGASLKHFAVNSQEYRRLTCSSELDERTLREIYLTAFEIAVKKARPQTVMCSYNPINGEHASDNKKLLWDILREEWGFQGIVVSDWGAVNDRVKGIVAGLDLEMPGNNGIRDDMIVEAVKKGELKLEDLDKVVKRIINYVLECARVRLDNVGHVADYAKHHILARKVAAQGSVLLKNEDGILPANSSQNFLVVGQLAKKMRYQGSGSSRINPKREVSFCDYLDSINTKYTFSAGYTLSGKIPLKDHIKHAVEKAKDKDYVIIFAGLTDVAESEAFDRVHLKLSEGHDELIEAVTEVNPNVIVVLVGGSPVEMPWIDKVKAVLNVYLGGEAGGEAVFDVVFGSVNPSGKLAETYPNKLDDVLATKYFRMGPRTVEYREGLYVGYRYFDSAKKDVLFPFGFGLSYTTFEYSNIRLSERKTDAKKDLVVTVDVKNTGKVKGAEVVQLYVHCQESEVFRAEKELKGFEKVSLLPGETKQVRFLLNRHAFAFYNVEAADWTVEGGNYDILIGASSRDIRLRETVQILGDDAKMPNYKEICPVYYDIGNAEEIPADQFSKLTGRELSDNRPFTLDEFDMNTTVADIGVTWFGKLFKKIFSFGSQRIIPKNSPEFMKKMTAEGALALPIRNFYAMANGVVPYETSNGILMAVKGKPIRGLCHCAWHFLFKSHRGRKRKTYKK